jgi:hypothetical protein
MFWFLKTPNWINPVLLMSMLGLIPAFGFLFLFGWLLAARDNLRAGILRVPPASWHYWRRGIYFSVPCIFYTLVWLAIAFLLIFLEFLTIRSGHPLFNFATVGIFAAVLLLVLSGLFCYTFGAVMALADARGILATLNPSLVWRTATGSSRASWRFLGAYVLGGIILFGISSLIPLVGILAAWLLASAAYLMSAPALADITVPTKL